MSDKVEIGWGWPGLSKKAHFFRDGRSLCGKWAFFGEIDNSKSAQRTPDDCAECRRTADWVQMSDILEYLDSSSREAGRAGEGAEVEPTVEEWEALEICVRDSNGGHHLKHDAREAFRKLNAASALRRASEEQADEKAHELASHWKLWYNVTLNKMAELGLECAIASALRTAGRGKDSEHRAEWGAVSPASDATEAHVLEVSCDGYGFVPSRMFEELASARRALEDFQGGGLCNAQIRRWVPAISKSETPAEPGGDGKGDEDGARRMLEHVVMELGVVPTDPRDTPFYVACFRFAKAIGAEEELAHIEPTLRLANSAHDELQQRHGEASSRAQAAETALKTAEQGHHGTRHELERVRGELEKADSALDASKRALLAVAEWAKRNSVNADAQLVAILEAIPANGGGT